MGSLRNSLGRLRQFPQLAPPRAVATWWGPMRPLRLLLTALAALLATLALALAALNLRLQGILRRTAADAGVGLSYAAAYTVRPGVVKIHGLRVTGGSNVPYNVATPHAELRIDVLDLVLGRLHVSHVRAHALELRVAGVAEDDTPSIGRERDLTALSMLPSLPSDDGSALRIDRLDATVASLEVGDYHLTGILRLSAESLELSPRAPVVGTAKLSLDRASLVKGDQELLGSLRGSLDVERTATTSGSSDVMVADCSTCQASLQGSLELSGGDTGELLEFAGVPDSVGFMFASVQGRPFTLATNIVQRPGAFLLREVRAESGPFRAVGSFRDTPLERAGAFLLTEQELSAGILVGAREASFVLGADVAWLTQSQQVLGLK